VTEAAMSPSSLKLYEAQFFGFTPQTCMVRVYSAFQDFLNELLLVVEAVFVRKLSGTEPNGEQLCSRARECSQKLQIFLQERFKRLTCLMETVLVNNVLSVPPNVLLPDDQPHKKYFQRLEEVLNLESSLAELQLVYQAEVCGRQALLQLDGILRWIVELQAAWMQEGMASFHDSFHAVIGEVNKKRTG
uniref:Protein MIS12 homolog n=1 Tax=Oncorhynchus tshawytscha TaxID=74940 RepID=A0AAZ3R4Q5_ONCTS